MPWKPGETGNPGGRPKGGTISAGQALARQRFALAVARLAVIVRRGSAQDAIAAIRLLAQIAGVPLNPTVAAQPDSRPPEPPTMPPAAMRAELERVLEQ
jgi:hypothetical protein